MPVSHQRAFSTYAADDPLVYSSLDFPPPVYYPGTRRLVPGPVTTHTGTGRTYSITRRVLEPGYPVFYVSPVMYSTIPPRNHLNYLRKAARVYNTHASKRYGEGCRTGDTETARPEYLIPDTLCVLETLGSFF